MLVRIWNSVIVPAEKPRSVRRYSLRNDDAGSDEQRQAEARRRQQEQPSPVDAVGDLPPPPDGICRRPGPVVGRGEAPGLGDLPAHPQHHRHRGERHEEQDPPRRRPEPGHGHEHHREAGAERAGGAQHGDGEGP